MKKTVGLVTAIMISMLAVASIVFAWGNKNVTGGASRIINNGSPFAIVEGYTEGGYLWLGFSFKCGDGGWEDRKPKKVKGPFQKQFDMRFCPKGYSQIRACLWKGKSGGLMQGRVDCMDY